ncbi:MAG: U32 family peptidase C-terminal domain-containing protein [Candidatus Berkelbacteria bacterium]|nr:U32 family peptidase C-terminal domain-containing protein [Candidatus Berkelbacteria bacterium]
MNILKKPELLAPAGNLDILKIALLYGADAIYCGSPKFAMRARVGFDMKSLKEGIDYAHSLGKKVYLTVNAFPHSREIEDLKKHIEKTVELNPDALIVADPGIVDYILKNFEIPVHLSTQANTTNHLSAKFWQDRGVQRIVMARELSLKDIALIHKDLPDFQIETFIHGAMCMAHSGRCQISNYMTNRDPNKGACIQACRFKYKMYALEEELRPGELFPIYEDEDGTHILNSKDLCMIEHIPELVKAGICSLKIEGRLKSEYYVATVVRAYRKAIDQYFESPRKYSLLKSEFKSEIEKSANRGFTTGFYFDQPENNYESSKAEASWGYIGQVINYNENTRTLKFEAKNYLPINSELEIITPRENYQYFLREMTVKGESAELAHANNIIEVKFDKSVPPDSLIRIKL